MRLSTLFGFAALTMGRVAIAQPAPPADESVLGELIVTGHAEEHVTRLAVLPSLAPDLEDVIVRSVVRHDLELSGMFDIVAEKDAPPGMYGFDDPVNIDAWRNLGAEVIVKVAARGHRGGRIQVLGLAYFLNVGKDPVYEKRLVVEKADARVTAHRITDALLGAITGRPGGFASRFTYSGRWGKSRRIFTLDSDGNDLLPVTNDQDTSIAPTWGPRGSLYFSTSRSYSPFHLVLADRGAEQAVPLSVTGSVFGTAFNHDFTRIALAISTSEGSAIWTGKANGTELKRVSTTPVATHPVFSPSGKLAWIGGDPDTFGSQRVFVEGQPVSPAGFTAAAPTFCDTEDGIRLVYSVGVGGDREDLVMSGENGGKIARLTQNQGTNTYPACSVDGRLLAFFSTRKHAEGSRGLYMLSLKRWVTARVSGAHGESLRWTPLPPATKP
ncbi:MAG: PD40 domain-containing protein [Polyangiaceae bacterium]|nr:PD40 domain-containing protein [Polyangiaceae bacterium]